MELLYYCLAIFFILLLCKFLFQKTKRLPPSPLALPVLGHLPLLEKPLHRKLQTLSKKYGPVLLLQLGCRSVLVVSSLSAVEECFGKNDVIFANRPRALVGEHLGYNYTTVAWSPYGHHWRSLRRLAVTARFSSNSLQTSSPIRNEEVHCVVNRMYRGFISDGGFQFQKVDLKSVFLELTLNIIMGMVSGKRCFGEEAVDKEMGREFLEIHNERLLPGMLMNVCDFLPVLRLIGFQEIEKRMVRLHRKRDAFLQRLIYDRRCSLGRRSNSSTAGCSSRSSEEADNN